MLSANPDTSTSYVDVALDAGLVAIRQQMAISARTTIAAVLLLATLLAGGVLAQTPWHEGFEGAEPSWRDAGGDAQYHVIEHRRFHGDCHTGSGCEWLQFEADGGSHVYFSHDVGRPWVIDELTASVWVKSDRPGVQLAVRIVLPRTLDPRTGRPLATIIPGSGYTNVGHWQELRIEGLPRLLTRQVHLLRMQLGPQVDDREAYLDAVLLNVYGGAGVTNVWIDDLDVAGYAASPPDQASSPQTAAASSSPNGDISTPLAIVRLPPVQSSAPRRTVKLVGSVLLVDGRPMFPRIIQHRGEPLDVFKKLGFNAVWLQRLPAPELLEEADRLGLWVICPPPRPVASETIAEFGPQFDCVLAWDLGSDLTEAELESTQQWAEQVHAADHRGNRPLICRARADLRGYSRPANLLLIDRRPLCTSLELSDYSTWIRRQPLLASLGTPVWTTVQTQPNERFANNSWRLSPASACPRPSRPSRCDCWPIRRWRREAAAWCSRPIAVGRSDPDTRQRAMALELLNLELEVMEPWAAAGSLVATTAESNLPAVSGRGAAARNMPGCCCRSGSSPVAQCVPPQSAANALRWWPPACPNHRRL